MFIFSKMYKATISHSERPIWLAEIIIFTLTEFKGTFQAFFNPYLGDFEFFGGLMLGPKDLKGPSGQKNMTCSVPLG